MAAQLKRWKNFVHVSEEFLDKVQVTYVCQFNHTVAFLKTADDGIFITYPNKMAIAGLLQFKMEQPMDGKEQRGDAHFTEPKLLEELSQKSVVGFADGSRFWVAWSKKGEVYTDGINNHGQLGNGSIGGLKLIPTLIRGPLEGKAVTAVACGYSHCLALTNEGEVFAWGQNGHGQIGDGTTCDAAFPKKVNYISESKYPRSYAVGVACGYNSSLLLLNSGKVHAWGSNEFGQLGLGNRNAKRVPSLLPFFGGQTISKISCGWFHALALSNRGNIFAWGRNDFGQLGTGDRESNWFPEKLEGTFTDVLASGRKKSAAISKSTYNCNIWGEWGYQPILKPFETLYKGIPEAFAFYMGVYPHLMDVKTDGIVSVRESFRLAFNCSETSDIKFIVEEQVLYAHRAVLMIRCEHFRAMLKNCWLEAGQPVEITEFSYLVYRAFLYYLYCGEVEVLPVESAIELLDLAKSYLEHELQREAVKLLLSGITVENAAHLYAVAIKYEVKNLEEYSFTFCVENLVEVMKTEAFAKLDGESCKLFLKQVCHKGLIQPFGI